MKSREHYPLQSRQDIEDAIHAHKASILDLAEHLGSAVTALKYAEEEIEELKKVGDIIIPKNITKVNTIISRAMTYISEDAEEDTTARQIFYELASVMFWEDENIELKAEIERLKDVVKMLQGR